jgi:transcriptional regulator with XRE-family HTH domain
MGTSQSAIARIESGEENITLDTLERLVLALKGRFLVSITPEEMAVQQMRSWWNTESQPISTSSRSWRLDWVAVHRDGNEAILGVKRTSPARLVISSAGTD